MVSDIQIPKVRYVAGGTLGEPPVFSAITGIPIDEIKTVTIKGHGLRIQPLDNIQQNTIREDLRAGWNDRGVPFYGATTLVRAQDEETEVSMAELTQEQWQKVKARLGLWNYHEDNWFALTTTNIDTPEGTVSCFMEVLPDDQTLKQLPEGYRSTHEYQVFITTMSNGIHAFRANTEGSPRGIEK